MIPTTIDPVLMAIADQQREELGPIFCDAARAAFAQAHPTEESLPDWWQLDETTRETHKDVAVHLFALGMQAMVAARDADSDVVAPNPFEGWTIQPWNHNGELYAFREGDRTVVARTYGKAWCAWLPSEKWAPSMEGVVSSEELAKRGAESRLVAAGANIPWFKP